MNNSVLKYLPDFFTSKSIKLFVILLVFILLGLGSFLPVLWLIISLIAVGMFFYFSNKLSILWADFTLQQFRKKLFRISLIIRIIWVFFSFILFQAMTGQPYEFHAADSIGYHGEAVWIVDLFHGGQLSQYWDYIGSNYSDMGYPLYLSSIYLISWKSILVARIIKAILGAYTVVLMYRIAARNFGESAGRLAGIIGMLLPNLIYYCGLHTKETELVFLTVAFINQAEILIHSRKYHLKNIFLTLLLGLSLFLFRTVLGASAIVSLLIAFVFSSKRIISLNRKIVSLLWILSALAIFSGSVIFAEVNKYWEARTANLQSQMTNFSEREQGNTLAAYGKSAIFVPLIVVAPFPTLVNIEGQENHMMLAGAYYTRNIYAFFIIIALFWLIQKGRFKNHLPLLLLTGTYLFILSMSGFALSERFHMPVLPFLAILAAFGITQMNRRNKRYFVPYLIIISIIIIGWNWFKLAGRGLV